MVSTDLQCACYSRELNFSVAIQPYLVDVGLEQVILGNDVLLKCDIPSFEADFVSVLNWADSDGLLISPNENYGNSMKKNLCAKLKRNSLPDSDQMKISIKTEILEPKGIGHCFDPKWFSYLQEVRFSSSTFLLQQEQIRHYLYYTVQSDTFFL